MNNLKRTLVYGVLLGNTVVSMADGTFIVDNFSIGKGETKEVVVKLLNDADYRTFSLKIALPAGLSFVQSVDETDTPTGKPWFEQSDLLSAVAQINMGAVQGTTEVDETVNLMFLNMSGNSVQHSETGDVLFTFKVKRNDTSADGANNIVLSDGKVSPKSNSGAITYQGGQVLYTNFDASKNFLTLAEGSENVTLTPGAANAKTIDVEMTNEGGKIGAISGYIQLTKGLSIVPNSLEANARSNGAPMISLGTPSTDAAGVTTYKFTAGRLGGAVTGTSGKLFSFKVVGADVDIDQPGVGFDQNGGSVTIKDIEATNGVGDELYDMSDGGTKQLVVTIDNPSEPEWSGDGNWKDYLSDETTAAAGSIWADEKANEAKVAADYKDVAATASVQTAITEAKTAIANLRDAINTYYKAGELHTAAASIALAEKKTAAINAVANILTAADNAVAAAGTEEGKVNTALGTPANSIPAEYKENADIKAADAVYQAKKTILEGVVSAAKAAGTAGNAGVYDTAISEYETARANLNSAISTATTNAGIEEGKVTTALAVEADAIPTEYKENAAIKAADTEYQAKKTVLEGAVAAAKAAGTAADAGVYDTAISNYNTAMVALNSAISTATTNAATEEAKVTAALAVVANTIPTEYKENAAIKAADTEYQAKKTVLEGAVEAAKAAGTAADAGVYDTAISNYNTAMAALNSAISTATTNAATEEGKVTTALAVVANPIPTEYKENAAIKAADTEYQAKKTALEGAVEAAKAAGTAAEAGVYDTAISEYNTAKDALNSAISTATTNAATEEAKVTAALAVEANAIPAEYKEDAAIKAADTEYQAKKTVLEGAVAAAKAVGTAADAGVYDTAISEYNSAMAALNSAIAAAAGNATAEAAKVTAAQANVADAIPGKFAANEAIQTANTTYLAKKSALDGAVAAAEAAGTAGQIGVYDTIISEYEAAVSALNGAIAAAVAQEAIETAKVTEALAVEANTIPAALAANAAVQAADATYQAKKTALEGAVAAAEAAGTAGEVGVYDTIISEYNAAVSALNAAIATAGAADGDLADLQNELDDTFDTVNGFVADEETAAKVDKSNANFGDLTAAINAIETANATLVSDVQADYNAGNLTAVEFEEKKADIEEAIAAAKEQIQQEIVKWLQANQLGDVTGDGRTSIFDYTTLAQDIANGEEPTTADIYAFARANANYQVEAEAGQTPVVSVADMTAIVNLIRFNDPQGEKVPAYTRLDDQNDALNATAQVSGNTMRIALNLQNSQSYTACQMDVVLPEGMTIAATNLTERTGSHAVMTGSLQNGAQRIVVSSADNAAILGASGAVIYIDVEVDANYRGGDVEFTNVIFSDLGAGAHEFGVKALSGEATGISAVKGQNGMMDTVYNMGGRVMNALKKGINIIRRADGTTEKVIRK